MVFVPHQIAVVTMLCLLMHRILMNVLNLGSGIFGFPSLHMKVKIHVAYITFRTEGILRAEIAEYEEAEKFCIQLISEVRTLWF
jgi:hypothetical protein